MGSRSGGGGRKTRRVRYFSNSAGGRIPIAKREGAARDWNFKMANGTTVVIRGGKLSEAMKTAQNIATNNGGTFTLVR